jgi:hypothetical protein
MKIISFDREIIFICRIEVVRDLKNDSIKSCGTNHLFNNYKKSRLHGDHLPLLVVAVVIVAATFVVDAPAVAVVIIVVSRKKKKEEHVQIFSYHYKLFLSQVEDY